MSNKRNKIRIITMVKGNEQVLVFIGLAVAFIVLCSLVFIIYTNITDKIQLELKFDSEKSFNSVYLALSDSSTKALRTMKEEGVSGVGIYSANGKVYQSLGDAPGNLPLKKLLQARQSGQDSTLGLFFFNQEDQTIEYFRLSRLNVMFETGKLSLSNGVPFASADYPEIVYVKFNGTQYYKRVTKVMIYCFIAIVAIAAVFVVVINIYLSNRRYKLELQKNQNLAHLGAAARTLTHEIKNPLSAMTIQSALMRKTLPSEFDSDLDVMDHEIARLTSLTNRVSEFLRNPVGNPEIIELVSFISDVSKLFAIDVKLSFHGNKEVYVDFDRDRARSVIENLIKNATESCSNRDPQVEVDLSLLKKDSVRIMIMDRGDGLSDDIRQKIYDPFFTTKIHGSGIGLSITKQFIEAQKGSLRLINREGGGTIAEIILKRRIERK